MPQRTIIFCRKNSFVSSHLDTLGENFKFIFNNAFCSCQLFIVYLCYSSVLVTGILSVLVSFRVYLRACEASGEFRSQILSFPLQTITFSSHRIMTARALTSGERIHELFVSAAYLFLIVNPMFAYLFSPLSGLREICSTSLRSILWAAKEVKL